MSLSPYEENILEQPEALRNFARLPLPRQLKDINLDSFDRIILTGMGASHHCALPTWRHLVARGYSAWWLSTSELLDSPELVTRESLVWMTSQSGRSGEVVALLEETKGYRPKYTIGITNDLESPLAEKSDCVVDLCSGDEATVSSKSYLNSLAAHHLVMATLTRNDVSEAQRTVHAAAKELSAWAAPMDAIRAIATNALDAGAPRIALIGAGNQSASALLGALVIKEAAKLGAEGFVGGEFRHGPLEIAGAGLTAVFYMGRGEHPNLQQLSSELVDFGSTSIELGATKHNYIVTESSSELSQMMLETKFTQLFSVELARAQGLIPGEFRFGKKITSSL